MLPLQLARPARSRCRLASALLPSLAILAAGLAACGGNSTATIGAAPASAEEDAGNGGTQTAPEPDASLSSVDPAPDASVVATRDAATVADSGVETDAADGSTVLETAHVKVLASYTGSQASYAAITSFHANLTMVSMDLYGAQTDGSITGSDDLDAVAHDRAYALGSFACITNFNDATGNFDASLAHAVMVTNEAAFVGDALELAKTGFTGIDLDFESLAYSANVADDRAAYSAFVHDLASKLHAAGLQLLISVPAKSADVATDTWTYPYDLATLAADVDAVRLLTYDESGPGWSAPGPVAGLDWTTSAVAYAVTVVPPAKVLLSVPAYGYDWDLTASTPSSSKYVGTTVNWTALPGLVATAGAVTHLDAKTSSPYVDYTSSDGHKHEVWYENAASIGLKTRLVTTYALGGMSMWALGEEDGSFWSAAYGGI